MKQRPLFPGVAELRQTHAVLLASVALPGALLTAISVVSLALHRLTFDIILGILSLAMALWIGVGGFAAWLLVRRSERYTRLQHDFVSNVSHELRTPLTGIRVMVETLRLGRADEQQTRRALELLDAETGRLAALVEEVLEFGRLSSGARHVELTLQRVDEVVDEALREFEILRLGDAAEVVRELPPGMGVWGERRALLQVLVNLLSNAFKYGHGGRIWLRAGRDRKKVWIAVEDEGPGVPLQLRRRIFREFVRGEQPEVIAQPGTGLGLAISQRLASAQRGTLRYEPRPGGGSRFVVTLQAAPITTPAGTPTRTPATTSVTTPATPLGTTPAAPVAAPDHSSAVEP